MASKFELYEDSAGKWRFRMKAGNGEIILSSEAYESKQNALNGIKVIKKDGPTAIIEEV
jgi:hypothetical protein